MERAGKAITLVSHEEGQYLTEIEMLINKEIKRYVDTVVKTLQKEHLLASAPGRATEGRVATRGAGGAGA